MIQCHMSSNKLMSHACAKSQGGSLVLTLWRGCQSKSTSEALYFCVHSLNHQKLGRFADTSHFEEVDHGYDCDDPQLGTTGQAGVPVPW